MRIVVHVPDPLGPRNPVTIMFADSFRGPTGGLHCQHGA